MADIAEPRRFERKACVVCRSSETADFRTVIHAGLRFQIRRCTACGMIFVSNPVVSDFPAWIAPVLPKTSPGQSRLGQGINYSAASINVTVLNARRRLRILDVGCGKGALGVLLSRRLQDRVEYMGLKPASRHAQTALGHSPHVLTQTLEQFAERSSDHGVWDVVVIDNIPEHLLEPAEELARAKAL